MSGDGESLAGRRRLRRYLEPARIVGQLAAVSSALGEGWLLAVTADDGRLLAGAGEAVTVPAAAFAPLVVAGEELGRLWVAPPGPAEPPDRRPDPACWAAALASLFGAQLAVKDDCRAVAAEALEGYRELALLHRAALELNGSLERREVAEILLRQFAGIGRGGWGIVYGLEADGPPLRLAVSGRQGEEVATAAEGLGLLRFLTAGAGERRGIFNDPDARPETAALAGMVGALLVMPLATSSWRAGMLALLAPPGSEFVSGDLKRTETLAAVAASALRNADLFAQRRLLSRRLLKAHEKERERLARELHDGPGQNLLALKLKLQTINQQAPAPELDEAIAELAASIKELREVFSGLLPVSLAKIGIRETIISHAASFGERTGIAVSVAAADIPRPSGEIELHLFRIFQEALNNAARHAGADRIEVVLQRQGEELVLRIIDNGRGTGGPRPGQRPGLGLAIMEERARMMGGTFRLRSRPGQGVEIEARVPVAW